jgi:hypothetical protein
MKVGLLLLLVLLVGCFLFQKSPETGESPASATVKAAAHYVPPPWDTILWVTGGLLTAVGGVVGTREVAMRAKNSPQGKFMGPRKLKKTRS